MPELNQGPKLLSLDFDGTIALTSEGDESIKTVNDAYADAIDDMFGGSATEHFVAQGGHNHRTPAEIVSDLMPDASIEEINNFANQLKQSKLEILMAQIGKILTNGSVWPRLTNMFPETWSEIYDSRTVDNTVNTAIISAGHKSFIDKTLDVHGLPHADITITDEILVDLGFGNLSPELRAKPSTLSLDQAIFIWKNRNSLHETREDDLRKRILHVGDDMEKDRLFAIRSRVGFQLLTPEDSPRSWSYVRAWADLGKVSLLRAGNE